MTSFDSVTSLQHHSTSCIATKTVQQCCSLVEVGLGDGNEVRVHSSHDGDEGGLSSECREHTTELTRTRHIEQVLGLREGRGGKGVARQEGSEERRGEAHR